MPLLRSTVILALVLFAGFGSTQFARARQPKKHTVLVLGDSLSQGAGVAPQDAYPSLLQQKIREAHLGFVVQNASVGGDSTTKALRRLQNLLKFSAHFDVLVLELGFNDAAKGIPPKQIGQNICKIIDLTREKQPEARVVIIAVQTPPNLKDGQAFQAMFASVARKKDAELVPSLLGDAVNDRTMMQPDGIHPNAKGHTVAAENVWTVLRPLLQKLTAAN